MVLFSFIFLSLVSKSSVFWEGWSRDFLNQKQPASSKSWKCPDSSFSVPLHPSGDPPFTCPRAGGRLGLAVPWGLGFHQELEKPSPGGLAKPQRRPHHGCPA